ncbi:MAG: prepilin-type N-terminal cleavage/methylation domain-containing protein [Elusimicrobium sp.]|jgi:prepilin-type N-terminal cleavage/methylation domain-containing protein|nr:prepilin-type N-terminal cleavage/methylation domain-containing protein [Elusimicrobium sp.]
MVNKKGFTLVEVLVVVLVVGILAAIALPVYKKAVEKSRAMEAFEILDNIRNKQEHRALFGKNKEDRQYTTQFKDLSEVISGIPAIDTENVDSISTKHFKYMLNYKAPYYYASAVRIGAGGQPAPYDYTIKQTDDYMDSYLCCEGTGCEIVAGLLKGCPCSTGYYRAEDGSCQPLKSADPCNDFKSTPYYDCCRGIWPTGMKWDDIQKVCVCRDGLVPSGNICVTPDECAGLLDQDYKCCKGDYSDKVWTAGKCWCKDSTKSMVDGKCVSGCSGTKMGNLCCTYPNNVAVCNGACQACSCEYFYNGKCNQCTYTEYSAGKIWRSDRNSCDCPVGQELNSSGKCASGCSGKIIGNLCCGNYDITVCDGKCSSCSCEYFYNARCNQCTYTEYSAGKIWRSDKNKCDCPSGQELDSSGKCSSPNDCVVTGGKNCECPSDKPWWNVTAQQCQACPANSSWKGKSCECNDGGYMSGATCYCSGDATYENGKCVTCQDKGYDGKSGSYPYNCACFNGKIYTDGKCKCNTSKYVDDGAGGCKCPGTGGRTYMWNNNGNYICVCPLGQYFNGSQCVTCESGGYDTYQNSYSNDSGSSYRCACYTGKTYTSGKCVCTAGASADASGNCSCANNPNGRTQLKNLGGTTGSLCLCPSGSGWNSSACVTCTSLGYDYGDNYGDNNDSVGNRCHCNTGRTFSGGKCVSDGSCPKGQIIAYGWTTCKTCSDDGSAIANSSETACLCQQTPWTSYDSAARKCYCSATCEYKDGSKKPNC